MSAPDSNAAVGMVSFSTTPAPSPKLPLEVLLLIIQQSPRQQLKTLRLVSKAVAQLVDPILWRKVILVPHRLCITGFISVFQASEATRHITKLTYDARFANFFTHVKNLAIADTSQPMSATEEKRCRAECIELALLGCFDPQSDTTMEVAMLTKALYVLPCLRQVRVREFGSHSEDATGVPYFFHRWSKKLYLRPELVDYRSARASGGRSHVKSLLTAIFSAGITLDTLKSENLDASVFFGEYPSRKPTTVQQFDILKRVMTSMDKVDIAFKTDSLCYPPNYLQALQALLKPATKLTTLALKLTDYCKTLWMYADEDFLSDLNSLMETTTGARMQQPLLPCLEDLTINACICHGEDLVHFLRLHSRTLRRLQLSNVTLLGNTDQRGCWVAIIKQIRGYLRLDSMSFSGWISNGGRQQWFVSKDSVGQTRLKARVEKYVADKRIRHECPLEAVAIKPDQSDVAKSTSGQEFEGDVSWAMVYSQRADRTLAPPTFGAISAPPAPAPAASMPFSMENSIYTMTPLVSHSTTTPPLAFSGPPHTWASQPRAGACANSVWLAAGLKQWSDLKKELGQDTALVEVSDIATTQPPPVQQAQEFAYISPQQLANLAFGQSLPQ